MKAKGRRISHNVELADSYGSKSKYKFHPPQVDKKTKAYKPDSRVPTEHEIKLEIVKSDELKRGGHRTEQQKVNDAANRLNYIHKVGKTPKPSARGEPPKWGTKKPVKKETAWPGTHTSNATTKKMVAGMSKPRDAVAEMIKKSTGLSAKEQKDIANHMKKSRAKKK